MEHRIQINFDLEFGTKSGSIQAEAGAHFGGKLVDVGLRPVFLMLLLLFLVLLLQWSLWWLLGVLFGLELGPIPWCGRAPCGLLGCLVGGLYIRGWAIPVLP